MSINEQQPPVGEATQPEQPPRNRRKIRPRTSTSGQEHASRTATATTTATPATTTSPIGEVKGDGRTKQARKRARRHSLQKGLRMVQRGSANEGNGEDDGDAIIVEALETPGKDEAQRADKKEHSEVAESTLDSPSQQLLGE